MATGLQLKEQLDSLPTADRAQLALYLIESLDTKVDADAERLWEEELQRRIEQIQSGLDVGEPAELVMERLRQKYS
jgi:putative addiction module component (TIGR02574 family)